MNVIERVARVALRLGIGPNALTTAGFLVVVAAAAAFAGGAVRWGGALVLVSGLFDLLDGRVARLAGRATAFGAMFDAIMDRAGEAVLCAGIALFFLRDGLGRDQLTLGMMGVIAALALALLAAYVRARAAALGIESRVGVSPEVARMLLLGAAPLVLDRHALLRSSFMRTNSRFSLGVATLVIGLSMPMTVFAQQSQSTAGSPLAALSPAGGAPQGTPAEKRIAWTRKVLASDPKRVDAWHELREQRGRHTSRTGARRFLTRECHDHVQIGMSFLERRELVAKDHVRRRLARVEDKDLAAPCSIGQIPNDAHQRRDADAASDQHHAIRLYAREHEVAMRS